jgi:hypothetical protein
MVFNEDDINALREEEQSKAVPARRSAAERQRRQKRIANILAEVKRLNDARAFAEGLSLAKISENSPEWKRAWDYFYGRQS